MNHIETRRRGPATGPPTCVSTWSLVGTDGDTQQNALYGWVEAIARPGVGMLWGASSRPDSRRTSCHVAAPAGNAKFPTPRNAGPWTPPRPETPNLGPHDTRSSRHCPPSDLVGPGRPYCVRLWSSDHRPEDAWGEPRDRGGYRDGHGHGRYLEIRPRISCGGDRESVTVDPSGSNRNRASHGMGAGNPWSSGGVTGQRWTDRRSHPWITGLRSVTAIIS